MNIYTYVAANNPYFVRSLAHRFGHDLKKDANLSRVLEQLVAMHQEDAMIAIIENHPDIELFQDYFQNKFPQKSEASTEKKSGCNGCKDSKSGCSGCKEKANQEVAYMNLTGAEMYAKNKEVVSTTNVMLLAGATVIALAILNLKK